VKSLPVSCTQEQFELGISAWNSGQMVQDAFPFFSPEEREFLLTGLTPSEWEELFGKEDEQ
jgi:hypothetical protein